MKELTSYQYPRNIENPDNIVIFLHGYGANGRDLLSLAPELSDVLPNTVFISPDAIFPFEGGIPGAYQWYSLMDRSDENILIGARHAAPIINGFIDTQLNKFKLTPDRLFIIGFSQGAMLSIYTAYRRNELIGGVISFSGFMVASDGIAHEIKSKPPILLTHGLEDNVVPSIATEFATGLLTELGVAVKSHFISHLGHGIDYKCIEYAKKFILSIR